MTPANPERYVTDIPYARRFIRELAPAWLDFTALICGFAPPAPDPGFAWCELGCGHGVTTALLAAMHPHGRFIGFDLMPAHAEFGRALCRDARIENVRIEALDFAAACALELPRFDYIVAHGVYTWVDEAARADLRRFVERHLKPGGLLYLSYDCLPGWAADMPLQHLLFDLAARAEGDSIARFLEADRIAAGMAASGAAVLRGGAVGREWNELRRRLPPAYFVHEFLPPGWRPIYVTELRRQMAAIGLAPVGSATIRENVDAFTLDATARGLVATVADADLRELMRDYLLEKRFRRDVLGRAAARLDADATRRRIAETRYMLAWTPAVDAGAPSFDDPLAQRILALLAAGPGRPAALAVEGFALADLVAQILALAAAGRIWPVDTTTAAAGGESSARMNAVLRGRIGGPDEIGFFALPTGTAVELTGEPLQRYRDLGEVPGALAAACGLAAAHLSDAQG